MVNTIEDIIDLMADYAAPYLFIGSGFSQRYINTPDWESLLKIIAEKFSLNLSLMMLDCKDDTKPSGINYPKLGSILNSNLETFKVTQDSNYDFRNITALKEEISLLLIDSHNNFDSSNQELFVFSELLTKISGIITTNYDLFIETLVKDMDYQSYIGQSSLISKNLSFSEEIYKIHGCISDRESIVITAEDYHKFENRQKYILGKLTVIFTEYPLIFLGYSIEDENIRSILKDLMVSLTYDELKQVSEKWLFIEYKKDEANLLVKERVIELENGSRLIFNCVETDNYYGLYEKLLKINFRMPLQRRAIKYMKKMLHEYEIKPNSKVFVQTSDNMDEIIKAFKEGNMVSLTFGETKVFLSVNFFDLMQNVIFENNTDYTKDTKAFVDQFKKNIRGTYYPRYKYFNSKDLKEYSIEEINLADINFSYNKSVDDEYRNSTDFEHRLQYWLKEIHLKSTEISIEELHQFLVEVFEGKNCMEDIKRAYSLKYETNLKKLVTAYDILKFKKD